MNNQKSANQILIEIKPYLEYSDQVNTNKAEFFNSLFTLSFIAPLVLSILTLISTCYLSKRFILSFQSLNKSKTKKSSIPLQASTAPEVGFGKVRQKDKENESELW